MTPHMHHVQHLAHLHFVAHSHDVVDFGIWIGAIMIGAPIVMLLWYLLEGLSFKSIYPPPPPIFTPPPLPPPVVPVRTILGHTFEDWPVTTDSN